MNRPQAVGSTNRGLIPAMNRDYPLLKASAPAVCPFQRPIRVYLSPLSGL